MSGPYDSHYAFQGYDNQYQQNNQYQSTYPASGFSQPQSYYADSHNAYRSDYGYGYNNYNGHQQGAPAINIQGPDGSSSTYMNATADNNTADRGLLGALGGGAAGAYAGHKSRGHGVLGALGGAILGSLTEDYAKKGKKSKHNHKKSSRSNSTSSSVSNNSAMSGLGPVASSFFNQVSSKK